MRITFDKIEAHGYVAFKCAKCAKRRIRKKTFWMTVNPFNKAATGWPKTYDQVLSDVRAEARAWEASITMCATCEASS